MSINSILLEKKGANFYGYENINSSGEHHYHYKVIGGCGDLTLTGKNIHFSQWLTKKEYSISVKDIIQIELRSWHNGKLKWPAKVLRIYYKDSDETKIFGIGLGGKFSITQGWKDDAYMWKNELEKLLKK